MSTEPDTRPFTSAELAHFLEQLEREQTPSRPSVIAARPPRIVTTEPATMLGIGALVPFSAPRPRCLSRGVQAGSHAPSIPAAPAQPVAVARAPRSFPDPFAVTKPRARARWLLRGRAWCALGALLLAAALACLPSMPSRARRARAAAHRAPPPLPALPARAPSLSALAAPVASPPVPSAATASTPAAPVPPAAAAPLLDRAGTTSAAADDSERTLGEGVDVQLARDDATGPLSDAAPLFARAPEGALRQGPTGRPAARREAVDLLLAGRTRAALAAYRALPRAWLAEPALVQVLRQLERELRECGQRAGAPCGS